MFVIIRNTSKEQPADGFTVAAAAAPGDADPEVFYDNQDNWLRHPLRGRVSHLGTDSKHNDVYRFKPDTAADMWMVIQDNEACGVAGAIVLGRINDSYNNATLLLIGSEALVFSTTWHGDKGCTLYIDGEPRACHVNEAVWIALGIIEPTGPPRPIPAIPDCPPAFAGAARGGNNGRRPEGRNDAGSGAGDSRRECANRQQPSR